jgi:hypothetical protein
MVFSTGYLSRDDLQITVHHITVPIAGTVHQMSRVAHCLNKLMLRYIGLLKRQKSTRFSNRGLSCMRICIVRCNDRFLAVAGTVRQMSRVVHCLQKLMLRYIEPLKKSRKDARPMFATLDQFMGWLFTQTGRPQQRCGQQCMILFSALAPETSGEWHLALSYCFVIYRFIETPIICVCTLDQYYRWLFTPTGRPPRRRSLQCMFLFSAPDSPGGHQAIYLLHRHRFPILFLLSVTVSNGFELALVRPYARPCFIILPYLICCSNRSLVRMTFCKKQGGERFLLCSTCLFRQVVRPAACC